MILFIFIRILIVRVVYDRKRGEKMKLKKAIRMGMLLCSLGSILVSPAIARADMDIQWSDFTSEETIDDYAEDIAYSMLRGSNLNYGDVKISKMSSNRVHIYGCTQCFRQCSNVYLSLYLEQKSNGSYYTYDDWDFDATNVFSMERGIDVYVPAGHYYRLRGYHAAKQGGIKESTTTLTSGIWVN